MSSTTTTFTKLGVPAWLTEALKQPPFGFTEPLPVQRAVVPFALHAFSSWLLHCDVGLSSPTGSGKTLCYCIPLLHSIVEQRNRFAGGYPDRHIRGVVVVPTSVLAEQVHDVLRALAAPAEIVVGTLFRSSDDGSNLTRSVVVAGSSRRRRFGTVDVLVATPQKLCSWIESLADEDDALDEQDDDEDSVVPATPAAAAKTSSQSITDVFGRTQVLVLDEADDLLSTSFFTSMAGRIAQTIQDAVAAVGETALHKMLCSATLTARISKVSDVKLQNAKYFSLDAGGADISAAVAAKAAATASSSAQLLASDSGAVAGVSGRDTVRPLFPLPSSLVEHLVIVRDDSKRHVTLLTTVRHALAELREQEEQKKKLEQQHDEAGDEQTSAITQDGKKAMINKQQESGSSTTATTATRPNSSWRSRGSSVIVFCQTAEIARVMGHFLATAGIDALELTTLSSEAERRQAALQVATAASTEQKVVVVSDALMRGIDMPGVGAVVQYDPPTTLQQYVHRVGRTARAGAPGASYVLLSKLGPSGKESDGQVALFKSFDSMLLRNGKVFNQVKLRELPEAEVAKADELLAKTQQRLNLIGWVSASNNSAAAADSSNANRRRKRGEK